MKPSLFHWISLYNNFPFFYFVHLASGWKVKQLRNNTPSRCHQHYNVSSMAKEHTSSKCLHPPPSYQYYSTISTAHYHPSAIKQLHASHLNCTALHCIYQNTKETITFFLNKLEPFFTKIYCDKYLFHSWLLKISSIKGKDTKRSSKRYRMVEKYRHNGKFKIKQMASWVSKLQKIVALSTT